MASSSAFFSSDNPYIVLIDEPVYSMWPKPLTDLLDRDGPGLGIKRVALLYSTNDFTETQADAVRKFIKGSNSGLDIVFDQGVPTATSNYTALLEAIRAASPDAVLHFGYVSNDVALLRNVLELGIKFKFLFCIYPSVLAEPFEKDVGNKALEYVFAYVASSQIAHAPNFGMSLKEYRAAWHEKYAKLQAKFDFNAVAGYTTGLVLEKALAMARSSRSAGIAQGDPQPFGTVEDAGRRLRARSGHRRAGWRAGVGRATGARWKRRSAAGDGLAT